MKTEFPLLSQLILNGDMAPITPEDHLIDIQEVTDRYWGNQPGEGEVFYPARDLGCLVPPFPYMWMESTAKLISFNGSAHNARVGYKVECKSGEDARRLLGEGVPFDLESLGWTYMFRVVFDEPDRLPAHGVLFVDNAGNFLSLGTGFAEGVDDDRKADLESGIWQLGKALFFAISMMNCRNVTTSTRQTRQRGGKKTKRRGLPSVEYRVIHLPKSGSGHSRAGAATGSTKLHTARGHFKTYTADAPLMGKHTGTYYWGWQVRGNKDNGEIVSAYQVGAA